MWEARSVGTNYGIKRELGGAIGDGVNAGSDIDLFALTLEYGDHLLVDIDADELDDGTPFSEFDSYVRIFDAMGYEVANNDDAADPDTLVNELDSALRFTAANGGTYYVGISGFGNAYYDLSMPGMGMEGSVGAYYLQLTRTANGVPVVTSQ